MANLDLATQEGAIVIVCAADDNYAMPLAVMLRSVEANLADGGSTNVYVLANGLSGRNRTLVERSLSSGRLVLRWIEVNDERLARQKVSRHVTATSYCRLLIQDLLEELPKVIYLDCDLVVLSDLEELWKEELGDSYLLAVAETSRNGMRAGSPGGLRTHRDLGIPPDQLLFNAGVLVMSPLAWSKADIAGQVFTYLKEYNDRVRWWDQDGLNAVLGGAWRRLDDRWNVMTSLFRDYESWRDSPFDRSEYRRITKSPHIVHYLSVPKPWQREYSLPYRRTFFRYLDETEWAGWRPG